jgi:hypothetical protein
LKFGHFEKRDSLGIKSLKKQAKTEKQFGEFAKGSRKLVHSKTNLEQEGRPN